MNTWLDRQLERFELAAARFERWWIAPGPRQYGPGIFDFEPDWSGSIIRAWLHRKLRGRG